MRFSKSAASAALAVVYLANHSHKGFVQARQIGDHLQIPIDSAHKVLQQLARQGLIRSHFGRGGGYLLDKSPEQITLLDIVEAIDGPMDTEPSLAFLAAHLVADTALLQDVCKQVNQTIRHHMASITVADLAGTRPALHLALAA